MRRTPLSFSSASDSRASLRVWSCKPTQPMHLPSRATKIRLQPSVSFRSTDFSEIFLHTIVLEPLRAADQDGAAIDLALTPRPAVSAKSFGSASGTPASSARLRQRFGGRMIAVFLRRSRQPQQFRGLGIAQRAPAGSRPVRRWSACRFCRKRKR